MSNINLDNIRKDNDLEKSALHALFDGYLPSDLGNNKIKPLEYFLEIFRNYNKNDEYTQIIFLLENSIEIIKFFDKNYEYKNNEIKKIQYSFESDWDFETIYSDMFIVKNPDELNISFKFQNKLYSKKNLYDLFKDYSIFKFEQNIKNLILTENQLIIPSGWTSHKYGSHLISLFYEKIPNKWRNNVKKWLSNESGIKKS